MFYEERGKWAMGATDTPFYSETLNNAICAVGASLNTGVKLSVPEPADEFFSARAKALLEIEMDSPSIATVQALVIMSATEAACTRDARGWLYCGMAVRLSGDLGLHLDVSEQVSKGIFSQRDLEARRTTYWGVYIHESMWSLYLGRPWGISHQNITIGLPRRELDAEKNRRWTPYGSSTERLQINNDMNLDDPVEAYGEACVSLCELMRKINRTLYSGQRTKISALITFAQETRRHLSFWLDSLPLELKINTTDPQRIYAPHVLQLQ
ncbi:putative nitrogen assimilation transcription factor nit-4 [Rhizodiscina lignyota]|uniref:Nitrogen assimilation transcription factor nit-4 n=1 Tax=Rhizodiscina lignyota TaxID=1504668 RepID=A0A9P4IEV9_9PEZI|nr:putative nitrogen assimilation transcription factor nit-4 [Rhizodiscina lignyota]